MKKLSKWITNNSLLIIIVSVLLLIPSIIGYVHTKVNYDLLVYLPNNIDTIKGQNIMTDEFGVGAFAFVTADYKNNTEIKALENEIKKIDTVNKVVSIEDITDVSVPLDMLPSEILDKVKKDDTLLILVTFDNGTSSEETINAIKNLRTVVKDANKVCGMTTMVLDTMELSNKEIVAYVILAVLLVLVVLYFATDSYLVPPLLLSNIGLAILYNFGSNIMLGSISYITQAISAVLQLGVTMDFSIFLYNKYEQIKKTESNKNKAMASAIQETFTSVLGSSLTTFAGFLSLCSMELLLGKDIGLVMAKGVLCGLITVLTVLPALLLQFDKLITKTHHKIVFPKFKHIQNFAANKYILTIILSILVFIPAIYGYTNVKEYYKLDNSLPETLPCRISNKYLSENYGITSPAFILIDKNLKTNDLEELTNEIKNLEGIDMVLAPGELNKLGLDAILPERLLNDFENDKYQMILLNSTYEVASDEINKQLDEIKTITNKYDTNAIIAGESALTKDLIEIADHDFKAVNYISIAVIFVIMLAVLKSISLPFILVLVIEFAIILNTSFAFFEGTTLPFISSIVVGTIQLGATIDYAILMSNTYLELRKKNKKHEAIKETLEKCIPSIVVSALCFFAATFGVAIYSKIDMISSICKLLSRGAIVSMIVVSLLLPALLLVFDKLIMNTTKGMKKYE
ncbi:MAG: MMPL family transporter [Bacilli bacterium]|nr:MMPL family transporter [Bacilli bacterium]